MKYFNIIVTLIVCNYATRSNLLISSSLQPGSSNTSLIDEAQAAALLIQEITLMGNLIKLEALSTRNIDCFRQEIAEGRILPAIKRSRILPAIKSCPMEVKISLLHNLISVMTPQTIGIRNLVDLLGIIIRMNYNIF